jgi:hypothetical protein
MEILAVAAVAVVVGLSLWSRLRATRNHATIASVSLGSELKSDSTSPSGKNRASAKEATASVGSSRGIACAPTTRTDPARDFVRQWNSTEPAESFGFLVATDRRPENSVVFARDGVFLFPAKTGLERISDKMGWVLGFLAISYLVGNRGSAEGIGKYLPIIVVVGIPALALAILGDSAKRRAKRRQREAVANGTAPEVAEVFIPVDSLRGLSSSLPPSKSADLASTVALALEGTSLHLTLNMVAFLKFSSECQRLYGTEAVPASWSGADAG